MTSSSPKPPPDISPEGARPLGSTYTKNGFHYRLILRDGNIALFSQHRKPDADAKVLAYEVICIRIAPEVTIMEKVTPKREYAPSNECWGAYGWTFMVSDLERAKIKFRSLVAGV